MASHESEMIQVHPKIIAVDFDQTLCDSHYPDTGEPIQCVIDYIHQEQENGACVILWTCREGKTLETALDWCKRHNIIFDLVNDNVDWVKELWGDGRKIFADEYIDDKALLPHKIWAMTPAGG